MNGLGASTLDVVNTILLVVILALVLLRRP